jgi:hypothetical protein
MYSIRGFVCYFGQAKQSSSTERLYPFNLVCRDSNCSICSSPIVSKPIEAEVNCQGKEVKIVSSVKLNPADATNPGTSNGSSNGFLGGQFALIFILLICGAIVLVVIIAGAGLKH